MEEILYYLRKVLIICECIFNLKTHIAATLGIFLQTHRTIAKIADRD